MSITFQYFLGQTGEMGRCSSSLKLPLGVNELLDARTADDAWNDFNQKIDLC